MGTEVAEKQNAELVNADEAALAAEAISGIDVNDLVLPVIKLTQGQSGEVQRGEAETGEFVNSLTGANYGESFDMVISSYFKGRFYAPDDEDGVYVAASEVAPDNWPDEYAGQRFDEIPDAEEQHKSRANDPEDDFSWGSGPKIQTTHNYIGYLPDDPDIPVRLSLKGTSAKAHRKIATLLKFGGTPWSSTITVAAERGENKKKQPYSYVVASQGRQTSPEERTRAQELFLAQREAEVKLVGDSPEKAEAKATKAKGGLDVA